MSYSLTAITCTGDRPEAFALCCRWVEAQRFEGSAQWVVVDDGELPIREGRFSFHRSLGSLGPCPGRGPIDVEYVRLDPGPWPSLVRNTRHGLQAATGDVVAFVEDDDWYSPNYFAEVLKLHKTSGIPPEIVGSGIGRYYHAATRRWKEWGSPGRSSLCRTSLSGEALKLFRKHMDAEGQGPSSPFLDRWAWLQLPNRCQFSLALAPALVVSVKGLPGRRGIGAMHDPAAFPNEDPTLEQLARWVGPDAEAYRAFGELPRKESAS